MKLWFRTLLGAALGLLAAAAAHAQLTVTGVSASPASAKPGETVTYTVNVTNSSSANYSSDATFNITFTHSNTGATFTASGSGSPTGGFIAAATVDPTTNLNTPGSGTYTFQAPVPTKTTQAGNYRGAVSLSGQGISSVTVTAGGTGYSAPPSVSFSGPGSGATASVSITGGVGSIGVTNGGSGYTSPPTVVLSGTGSGATATAVLTGDAVSSVTVNTSGTGYTSAPTISFTGGGGTGATATSTLSASVTSVAVTSRGNGYTSAPTITFSGGGTGAAATATLSSGSFTGTTTALTIIGSPDLAITSLTYNAGTSYVGGDVIPMQLKFINKQVTNGIENVPFVPGYTALGFPSYFRVRVVLSSNPTFGDADDFELTYIDITGNRLTASDNATVPNRYLPANGLSGEQTVNWMQLLPGNFSGSYYVLAKIDALDRITENDPTPIPENGNNIWGSFGPSATQINLLNTNFPAIALTSHGTGTNASATGYSDNPSVSADGNYVVFASDATNLVTGDTNATRDIFIFDNQTSSIRRLSVSTQGTQGDAASNNPSISANGRYIAFSSAARNLVSGDSNNFADIFVADRIDPTKIVRVSVPTNVSGASQANNPSFRPSISGDGRFVVFESSATNLDSSYTVTGGITHIYVHDRRVSGTGAFDQAGNTSTKLVDVGLSAPASTLASSASIHAVISSDGSTIGFASRGTNLVTGGTTSGRQHVYVRPRANVGTTTSGIKLVSVADASATEGNADSQTPSLSSTGRYIAFASRASNLIVGDNNRVSDIFVYDGNAAVSAPVVRRMSVSSAGTESFDPSDDGFQLGSINPTISSDGRYVAFASLTSTLTGGDFHGQFQGSGATATATVAGGAITGITLGSGGSRYSQLSPPDVVITDTQGTPTTPARATAVVNAAGVVTGISVTDGGAGYSATVLITIASDANEALDIFVRDRDAAETGTFDTGTTLTQLVSANTFGYQTSSILETASTAASNIYPVISANGRYVVFPSDAESSPGLAHGNTNILSNDDNNARDIFLFDRRIATTVTNSTLPTVTITSPGAGGSQLVNTAIAVNASATAATDNGDPVGDITAVEFFVNGKSLGSTSTVPYRITWTPTAVGVYTLSAKVTDNFGKEGFSPNVSVTINALPSVDVTSPTAGANITTGTTVTVRGIAATSNLGATISTVQFFVNGTALPAATFNSGTNDYSTTWTPTTAGSYSLTATATDSIARQATSSAVSVTVTVPSGGGGGPGGTPPTVAIVSPSNGSVVAVNSTQTITATGNAPGGTVRSIEFKANGTSLGIISAFPFTVQWTPVTPGTYALTATATDNNGLQSTTTATTVTVDTGSSPTVAIVTPTSGSSVNGGTVVNLSATATDIDGRVTSVTFLANGSPVGTASAAPFTATWTPTAQGTYTLTAQARDNSGNLSTSAPITLTVASNRAPTVAVTSPTNGAILRVNIASALTATASDPDGSIASVQFFVNGVAAGGAITSTTGGVYRGSFTPTAEVIYRITANAVDSSGATTTSSTVTVIAAGTSDTIATGVIGGIDGMGKFAAINARGKFASVIAFAGSGANSKTYFFSSLPVGGGGSFSGSDASGASTISGTFTDTGAIGTLDGGRSTFSGAIVFPGAIASVAPGYYTGSLSGRGASSAAGIVGADGSIAVYATDGGFKAAGVGTVDATGAFSITDGTNGAHFEGKADPATGFLTGRITGTGRIDTDFSGATAAGVAFSDGFLRNLSTRGQVGATDATALIAGFVVADSSPKQVLIRAVGPSLTKYGVNGALANPQLKIYEIVNGVPSSTPIAQNDDWNAAVSVATAAVGAFPLDAGSRDSAILVTLPKGNYTANITGVGNTTGIALVELYDVDNPQPFSAQKVINVSTRGTVGGAQGQLIAGFFINGNTSKKVLVRGVGPTLAGFGLSGALADPTLRLMRRVNNADVTVRENDNWEVGNDIALFVEATGKVGAFGLNSGSKDAGILINLPPGQYSAILEGAAGGTGPALIEVYEVP